MKIIICLIFFLMASCLSTKPQNTKQVNVTSLDKILPKELYLEHRIPGCDSALAYMEHYVSPGPLTTSVLPELVVEPFISFENNYLQLENSNFPYPNSYFRFYISPKCFLNLDAQRVYDVFVQPEFHQKLKEIEQAAGDGYFTLGTYSIGHFGFQIQNGKVVRAGYPVTLKNR